MHRKNTFQNQLLYVLSLCALLGATSGKAFTWEDRATLLVGISAGYIVQPYQKSPGIFTLGLMSTLVSSLFVLGEKYPAERAQIKLLEEHNASPHDIKKE